MQNTSTPPPGDFFRSETTPREEMNESGSTSFVTYRYPGGKPSPPGCAKIGCPHKIAHTEVANPRRIWKTASLKMDDIVHLVEEGSEDVDELWSWHRMRKRSE